MTVYYELWESHSANLIMACPYCDVCIMQFVRDQVEEFGRTGVETWCLSLEHHDGTTTEIATGEALADLAGAPK